MISSPVTTTHAGRNADLISEVARLYAPDGARILDMTYGKGRFWGKTDLNRYRFCAMDIEPVTQVQADIRNLPFTENSFDITVFDPPYAHNSGTRNPHDYGATTTRYNGHHVAAMYNDDILEELYRPGIMEAFRVLNPVGGMLWVKCQDSVEREVQRWNMISIHQMALDAGFCVRDLFILTGTSSPQRWPGRTQWHARKRHSYLLVAQRPDERYGKLLSRPHPRRRLG